MATRTGGTRGASAARRAPAPSEAARPSDLLTRDQKLELYYYMRLTRSLEERLVNLYRQTKVVGGLFRSLGQEADAVGSAYALDRTKGDILSPLIRNLGSMLVQRAKRLCQPFEITRDDRMVRRVELNTSERRAEATYQFVRELRACPCVDHDCTALTAARTPRGPESAPA